MDLLLIISLFIALAIASARWGYDSRDLQLYAEPRSIPRKHISI